MAKESGTTTSILKYLRSIPTSWWFKVHGNASQDSGIPDIMGCWNGHLIAFEVKQWGKKTSAIQDHMIQKIVEAGGMVFVVNCVAHVRAIMGPVESVVVRIGENRGVMVEQAHAAMSTVPRPRKATAPTGMGDTPFG